MQPEMKIKHVIVDGSNIATEGRDAPSLAQLDEAVSAFIEEYAPDVVTVVVDATFPNRIDRKERQTYEDAVNANELITPPAGAIGRGDAFVLQIAKRAGATILSNDSFQEFHGEYPWLFERGRLIGGKPVPHVGWVFMERAPVRGPTSRRAVSEARKVTKAVSKAASVVAEDAGGAVGNGSGGGDEPAAPKAGRKRRSTKAAAATAAAAVAEAAEEAVAAAPGDGQAELSGGARSGGGRVVEPYNEAMPFIEFVGVHPVGSEVEATIERFSSHGAYVLVGEARAYVPLRNLADPAPRSAKEMLRLGETRRFVVVAVDPPRRGIDLAVPGVVEVPTVPAPSLEEMDLDIDTTVAALPEPEPEAEPAPAKRARASRARKAAGKAAEPAAVSEAEQAKPRRSRAKKAAEPPAEIGAKPVRRSRTKKAAETPAPPVDEAPAKARRSRTKKAADPVADRAPMPGPEAEQAKPRRSRAKKLAEPVAEAAVASDAPAKPRRSRAKKAAADPAPPAAEPAKPVRKARAKKADAPAPAERARRAAAAPEPADVSGNGPAPAAAKRRSRAKAGAEA
jgi:hypothetical protein